MKLHSCRVTTVFLVLFLAIGPSVLASPRESGGAPRIGERIVRFLNQIRNVISVSSTADTVVPPKP